MSTFPIIDFSAFVDGSDENKRRTASAIDDALVSFGCFYLTNHGIDHSDIDKCFQISNALFELPDNEKEKLEHFSFLKLGDEKVRGQTASKEALGWDNPLHRKHDGQAVQREPAGHEGFLDDFFKACDKLTQRLLDCLSLALDLSEAETLLNHHMQAKFRLSLLHYPPPVDDSDQPNTSRMRMAAHQDTGTLTLLFQAPDQPGLEIGQRHSTILESSATVESNGVFHRMDPIPGAIAVIPGTLLMRWTNARWRSAVHRVVADGGNDSKGRGRYSIAFFTKPDPGTVVDSLPGCWGEGRPKRWEAVDADEYLEKRDMEQTPRKYKQWSKP